MIRLVAALCLALLQGPPATAATTAGGGDWPMWQQGPLGWRHNAAEHVINPRTVSGLDLKWAFAYPKEAGTPRSQPAVALPGVSSGSATAEST